MRYALYSAALMSAGKQGQLWLVWRKIWLVSLWKLQFPVHQIAAIFSLIARVGRRVIRRYLCRLISVSVLRFRCSFVLAVSLALVEKKTADLASTWWQDETAWRDSLSSLSGWETDRESVQELAGSWANDKEQLHFGADLLLRQCRSGGTIFKSNYHKNCSNLAYTKRNWLS